MLESTQPHNNFPLKSFLSPPMDKGANPRAPQGAHSGMTSGLSGEGTFEPAFSQGTASSKAPLFFAAV
jgi:hypothetical protein